MLLTIDGTFLVAFISFLIFLFLIRVILFNPITSIIKKREDFLKNNDILKDETNDKTNNLLSQKENELKLAKKMANDMFSNEVEKVKNEADEYLNDIQKEARKIVELNQTKLKKETILAKNEIKNELNDVVNSIVSKVLKSDVKVKLNENQIDEYLKL